MAQRPFKMNKNEQYIECHRPFKLPNGKYSSMIRVYELLNPAKQSMLTTMDWSYEPVLIDPKAATGYNSVEIDGQSVNLEKLVQDLCKSRLRVNKQGYCYFQLRQGVADTTETYGFAFYRMNDVLEWPDYGVTPKPSLMNWDRLNILNGHTSNVKETEIHQKQDDRTMNEQLKSQNQKLTEQIKELQAKLDHYPKTPRSSFVPVVPSFFNFIRKPDYPHRHQTILQHWENNLNNFGTYTPTCEPVSGESYKSLSIVVRQDQRFDTDNWYFVGVKELATPILIYEGTANTVNVAGKTVHSPLEGNSYIQYNAGNDGRRVWIGLLTLAGAGARIGVRHA